MLSFTDMAERPLFLHSAVRVLRVISLGWGLMACAYAADPPAAEKQRVVPQSPTQPATTSKTVQIAPAPAKSHEARAVQVAPAPAKDDTPKGRYATTVVEAVKKKWQMYCKMDPNGMTYGRLDLVFYINKHGKVEDLRVVNDKESNRTLTLVTLRAVKDAEILPMPADVLPALPMNDPERLKIAYTALIY
jgi:outer membrane biosynthesis protein TonB